MGTEGHTAVMYRARPPAWLKGEVTRHCARCEGRVDWMQIVCPNCGAQLLKECPRCHCHVAMDTTFCTIADTASRCHLLLLLSACGIVISFHLDNMKGYDPILLGSIIEAFSH